MSTATASETPTAPAARGWTAWLRWLLPVAFLALVGWLLLHGIDEFDLPEMQRTLLEVPTLPALGIAVLALLAVAFTGLIDVVIARWLGLAMPMREVLRLAFVANALANVLNLSGAVGSGVRLLGFSAQRVELPSGAALIGLQVLSLPLGLSVLIVGKQGLEHSSLLAPLTFGLAAFVVLVTLREMFLPAWIRVREKNEGVFSAVIQSASRARRRFGGYVVHLGIVMIIVAVAASRSYTTHAAGTIGNGKSLSIAGYDIRFDGLTNGREPHRTWIGAKLNITTPSGATDTMVPRMNFYERSTDPIGTPAVRTIAKEDLYISLMAYDEKGGSASLKAWVFPLVGWIWWAIPVLVGGALIALWPSRRSKVSVAAGSTPVGSSAPPPPPSPSPDQQLETGAA